jgi:hypothetical protein
MNKIVLAVLVAVIGVAVWFALRAKYKVRGFCHRFLGNWRKDPRFKEAAIFGSALIVSLVVFVILPGL